MSKEEVETELEEYEEDNSDTEADSSVLSDTEQIENLDISKNLEDEEDDDDGNDLDEDNTINDINERKKIEEDLLDNNKFKNIFNSIDNLETSDSSQFLQKFDDSIKKDYIINSHQECLSKNYEEIKKYLNVIRDKNNNIIDNLHKTSPFLTKYEKTKILGIRLKQLNNNCKPYINYNEKILDNLIIANLELEQKKLPFIIQRPLPNNTFEYWKLQDLEIL